MGDQRKEVPHGIVQFNGTNYENWSFRVKMYLDAVNVLEVIESALEDDASNEKKIKYREMDTKAKCIIVSCIHDDYLDYVRDKSSAIQMWNALKNVFTVRSSTNQTILRKQLAKLKLSGDTKMMDHFLEFDGLVRQLKSAGAKLDERDLVSQLFVSLPESYDPLITALENIKEDELTLSVVKQRLLAEEAKRGDRIEDHGVGKSGTVFVARKNNKFKFNGKYHNCGKMGHMKMNCRFRKEANFSTNHQESTVPYSDNESELNLCVLW